MTKCTECGYENLDGLDYCDGCGAKLESGSAPASDPGGAAPATAASDAAAESPMNATVESASGLPAAEIAAGHTSAEGEAASRAPTGEIKPTDAVTPAPSPAIAPAASAPIKAKLTITRGTIAERRGHEFELESGKNLIGRWDPDTGSFPEVDLEQDDPEAKISRKHAMIIVESGKITLDDIGSLNGTYVNRGQRLMPGTPAELKDGDEIIIGKTFLKLTINPIS